ncbi:hypothetical protein [Paraflavitalea sp. CAU 1676]|uniref:hypothetical protein n=1 Tax=Paraflavitalea sp. CAU 1676 TaxID=3032598 RepID=UPI0023DB4886|nr:hypothetical protein [Paraflavitalea sp. CAU 1676]MDF2188997.1 hypothetical protein [Paraflavitalea sp. CAU 1676]
MRYLLFCLCCIPATMACANDTSYLKVHFLYGSRPAKDYKETESKWFGGTLGGHVGIEIDSNRILNFLPSGDFHVFKRKMDFHSTYAVHDETSFYALLGGDADSMKRTVVYIPVETWQKQKFDSIATAYLAQTPYDYALVGMRCGSAAYEILGQLDILKSYPRKKTALKIFYPKKLRKRLLKKAKDNEWLVVRQVGSDRRRWEQD